MRNFSASLRCVLAALLLIAAGGGVFGETYYWIGGTSGNWTDGSNWSLTLGGTGAGAYPSTSDDTACLASAATISLGEDIAVSKLEIPNPNEETSSFSVTISGDHTLSASAIETVRAAAADAASDATSTLVFDCDVSAANLIMHTGGNVTIASNRTANIGTIENQGTTTLPSTLTVDGTLESTSINLNSASALSLVVSSSGSVTTGTLTGAAGSVTNSGTILTDTTPSHDILSTDSTNPIYSDTSNYVYWTGSVDTDPTKDANWTVAISAWGTKNVAVIPKSNEPILSSGELSPANLSIMSGATFTVSGGTLTTGSLELETTSNLTISSGTVNADSVSADSGKIENSGSLKVSGNLTSTSGTLKNTQNLSAGSISVGGEAELGGTLDTSGSDGTQTYAGAVTLVSETTISATGNATFGASGENGGQITTGGKKLAVSTGGTAYFYGGFSDSTDLTVTGNSEFYGDNEFSKLTIDNSGATSATTATFAGGTTQTIGSISAKGNSSTNVLKLTSGGTWKVEFSPAPQNSDFSCAVVENSVSENNLKLYSDPASIVDSTPASTTGWFATKYYWLGGTSAEWAAAENWSVDGTNALPATASAPNYSDGTAEIVIQENSSGILKLGTDINVKSFFVKENAAVDFSTFSVTATAVSGDADSGKITNNGTIRLAGTQTITGTVENGADSTIEYYGAAGGLPWGKSYENLEFTDGATCTSTDTLTVSKKLLIANGTGNSVSLTGNNSFTDVQIGDSTVSAAEQGGAVVLNSSGGFNLQANAKCDSLEIQSDVELLGDVTTTDGQIYSGTVSLGGDATLTAGGNVTFGESGGSGGKITANGKKLAVSTEGTAYFYGGFSDSADVEVNGNAEIYGENKFTSLKIVSGNAKFDESNSFDSLEIDNSGATSATTATFAGGTTQKVGSISAKGNSSTNVLMLTSGGTWTAVFGTKPTNLNFSYVVVENSISVDSSASSAKANKLNLFPNSAEITDGSLPTSYSTKYWFTNEYYWFGRTNSEWTTAGNWFYDENGTKGMDAPPLTESGDCEIIIAAGNSDTGSPYILNLGSVSDTADSIKVKSIIVKQGATVNFAESSVEAAVEENDDGSGKITNNGRITLAGTQTITGTKVNGGDSTIEYYGAAGGLPWGKSYANLEFTDGAECSSAEGLTVSKKLLIANGTGKKVSLMGNNSLTDVQIGDSTDSAAVQGGAVVLNSSGGFNLQANAECDSLEIRSGVELRGDVTTAGGQIYSGAVSLGGDATLTADGGNGTVSFGGDVSGGHSLTVDGTAELSADVAFVCGTQTVHFKKNVVGASNSLTVGSGTEKTNVEFSGTVDSSKSIEVFGKTTIGGVAASIKSTESQIYRGDVESSIETTFEAENAQFAGNLTSSKNLKIDASAYFSGDSVVNLNGNVLTVSKDLFVSANSVDFKSPVNVFGNFAVFHGTVSQNANLSATKDIVLLNGAADSMNDDNVSSLPSGVAGLFSYLNADRDGENHAEANLSAFPTAHPDGTAIPADSFSAGFTPAAGITVEAGANFYDNGVSLSSSGEWFLDIPDNDNQKTAFAEIYNASVSKCKAKNAVAAAENCADGGGNENVFFSRPEILKIDYAKELNSDLSGTYTVYDNMIRVEFVDSISGELLKIENTNDEISRAVSSIKHTNGAAAFSGAFVDSEGTDSTDGKGDLSSFYLKISGTWNTDATGKSAGDAQSTDRQGVHQSAIPDIDIPKALGSLYETLRDCHKNRIAHVTGENRFAYTADRTAPVLVSAFAGQELHAPTGDDPSAQKIYDAHNFIEFRYSEAVDVGALLSGSGDVNVQATADLGAISNNSPGITVAGLASTASGSVVAGVKSKSGDVWTGSADTAKPHALYRKFARSSAGEEEVQTHGIRVSVAGFVDEENPVVVDGVSFRNYLGYIDSSSVPGGAVTRIANPALKDLAVDFDGNGIGNSVDASGTANHPLPALSVTIPDGYSSDPLYGSWDTSNPVFAPYTVSIEGSEKDSWAAGDSAERTYEVIGSADSSSNSYLEKIELHIFDNTHVYSSSSDYKWISRRGWISGGDARADVPSDFRAPEYFGGSRDATLGGTALDEGGIRRCSLEGASAAFTYSYPGSAETEFSTATISQKAKSPLFNYVDYDEQQADITTETFADGPYIGLYLNPSDTMLSRRTRFVVRYDPAKSFITDLAGNRLVQTDSGSGVKILNSVDVVAPDFAIVLAPIGTRKVLLTFTKPLSYNSVRLSKLDSGTLGSVLSGIARNIEIVRSAESVADASVVEENPFVSAELSFETDDTTGILLTMSDSLEAVTLENVESLWIRLNGEVSGSVGWTGNYSSWIQDDSGNGMLENTCHALSDFALNAVNVLYAYSLTDLDGDGEDDEGWDSRGIYGTDVFPESSDYAVHEFDADAGNYGTLVSGRDIVLQVQFVGGETGEGYFAPASGETIELFGEKKSNVRGEWTGDKFGRMTGIDWRVWLLDEFPAYSSDFNSSPFISSLEPESAGDENGLLFNFSMKKDEIELSPGDELQFLFKIRKGGDYVMINHDGDDQTPKVPLYALWMPKSRISSGDLSFVDLWSFALKSITRQRGGVTILNNVINASVREQCVLEVDIPSDGTLNVYVMTLDGNVVKRLAKGRAGAGTHFYRWDGTNNAGNAVARGLYFIRVSGKGIDETRKVMVVK